MTNEVLFFTQLLVSFGCILIALRIGGALALICLGTAATLLMNLFVLKTFVVFGLHITGGNICYAMVFLCTDLLSELYGPKTARKLVWCGFLAAFLYVLLSQFILSIHPAPEDFAHPHLAQIMALSPRIVLVSLCSYLLSQNLSISIYHKLKTITHDRHIWARNNVSTIIAQGFDTVFFTLGALYGILPNLTEIIITTFAIKVLISACDTPFIYLGRLLVANTSSNQVGSEAHIV